MKLSINKFKKKNVIINPKKRQKIPDICFNCTKLQSQNKYYYCEDNFESKDDAIDYLEKHKGKY